MLKSFGKNKYLLIKTQFTAAFIKNAFAELLYKLVTKGATIPCSVVVLYFFSLNHEVHQ